MINEYAYTFSTISLNICKGSWQRKIILLRKVFYPQTETCNCDVCLQVLGYNNSVTTFTLATILVSKTSDLHTTCDVSSNVYWP